MTTRRSWRVFDIPIRIDTSWFFIVAFVSWTLAHGYFPETYPGFDNLTYWGMGVTAALLLFVCVLLHELGHSLVAQAAGIPVRDVTLFIFGGVAQISEEPRRPMTELKIALAGPVVSVAIAAACFWMSSILSVTTTPQFALWAILQYLAIINTGILLFNLLPGFPLDGGRVLRAILWAVSGSLRKATRITSLMGAVLGGGLLVWGLFMVLKGSWFAGAWNIMLGFFLRDAAHASYWRHHRGTEETRKEGGHRSTER
jgi:Zn-dependent protease